MSDIRKGTSVKSLCANISNELLRDFNYALVCKYIPAIGRREEFMNDGVLF